MPRSKQALLSPRAASRNRLSTRNCAVFRLLAMIKPPRITPCSAIWRDGFNKWLTRLTLFGQVDRNVVDQPRAADPGGGEHAQRTRAIGRGLERFGIDHRHVIDRLITGGRSDERRVGQAGVRTCIS